MNIDKLFEATENKEMMKRLIKVLNSKTIEVTRPLFDDPSLFTNEVFYKRNQTLVDYLSEPIEPLYVFLLSHDLLDILDDIDIQALTNILKPVEDSYHMIDVLNRSQLEKVMKIYSKSKYPELGNVMAYIIQNNEGFDSYINYINTFDSFLNSLKKGFNNVLNIYPDQLKFANVKDNMYGNLLGKFLTKNNSFAVQYLYNLGLNFPMNQRIRISLTPEMKNLIEDYEGYREFYEINSENENLDIFL